MATGLDLVNKIRSGDAAPPSAIITLGLDRTHEWITTCEPGHVVFAWDVDPAYLNIEGNVFCPWIAALADQALFFASNTLCGEGEGTRMADFHLSMISDIAQGTARIDAVIRERVGDRMHGTCDVYDGSGALAGHVVATIDVTR